MSVVFSQDYKEKKHIHLVCIGHRDHGKSSILGRLFYDTKNIDKKTMDRIKQMAKELNREGFELAFVMDQIKEERMRGITIGLAHKKLETNETSFTFADAPGHKDFIKNMLTGASEADASILVVAADEGIKEQTEEHLFLSKMLGVPRAIVVVNKMDLVNFDKKIFEKLKKDVEKLIKKVGYTVKEVPIIPCSALQGGNVVKKTPKENEFPTGQAKKMAWWKGLTILEILENLLERDLPCNLPLRLPIQDVYNIKGKDMIIGRVSSGMISIGDKIIVMPQKSKYQVEKMFIHDQEIKKANPGDNLYLTLKKYKKGEIQRGNIIGEVPDLPTITSKLKAQVIILNRPQGITIKDKLTFEMLTESLSCQITKLIKKIDTRSGATIEKNPKKILDGESGSVEIKSEKSIYIEKQSDIPQLSCFRLKNKEKQIAFGVCVETK